MKKNKITAVLCCFFFIATSLNAQKVTDPFERLRQLATTQPVQKQTLRGKVFINENDPSFKVFKKPPIAFKPFPMVDKIGKPVNATDKITLANGKTAQAGEVYSKVNELEKSLNEKGYTLRNENQILKLEITRNKKLYDNKIKLMPKSVGPLLNESNLAKYLTPTVKVGNIRLKPMAKYTPKEKAEISKIDFSTVNGKLTWNKPLVSGNRNITRTIPSVPTLMKEIKKDYAAAWPMDRVYLGDPDKFAVAFSAGFGFHVKQYSKCDSRIDPSTYSAYATALAKGSLFGTAFDIIQVDADINVPAKFEEKGSSNFVIALGGINVVNEHNNATTMDVTLGSRPAATTIDKSLEVSVPIAGFLSFEGKLGVRGGFGVDYGFTLDKTNFNLRVYPYAKLAGYVEVGFDFVIGDVGVGGEITFLEVGLPLNGNLGVVASNSDKVVIVTGYNLGYIVKALNGRLYVYGDFCLFHCWRLFELEFFTWTGLDESGTFAKGVDWDAVER